MSDIGNSVNLDAHARVRPLIAVRPGQRRPQVAQGSGDPCGRRRGGPRGRRVLRSEGRGARGRASRARRRALRRARRDPGERRGHRVLRRGPRARGGAPAGRAGAAEGDTGGRRRSRRGRAAGRCDRRDSRRPASGIRGRVATAGAGSHRGGDRPRRRAPSRAARRRARDPVRALEGGVRLGGGAGSSPHRPGVDRCAGQRRARGGHALRTIPGLPRQGLHTPGSGGDREPRLHAQRRGAHESTPRGRGLRACSAAREKV